VEQIKMKWATQFGWTEANMPTFTEANATEDIYCSGYPENTWAYINAIRTRIIDYLILMGQPVGQSTSATSHTTSLDTTSSHASTSTPSNASTSRTSNAASLRSSITSTTTLNQSHVTASPSWFVYIYIYIYTFLFLFLFLTLPFHLCM